jgi:hypothetical protein
MSNMHSLLTSQRHESRAVNSRPDKINTLEVFCTLNRRGQGVMKKAGVAGVKMAKYRCVKLTHNGT